MIDRRRLAGPVLTAAPVALLFALAGGPAAVQPAAAGAATTAAATPTATPSGTPSPTPVPSPTPCESPTPLPTPTPTPSPSPTVTPAPTPAPCASPTPGPTATPSATPSGSATHGGGAPGPPGGSSTPSKPPTLPAALVSSDPVLATQVQTILANPVSAQHPDLVHFRPPAPGLAAAAPPSPPAPPADPGATDLRLPILVSAGAFGLAAFCVLGEMHSHRGRWSLRRNLLQIVAPLAGAVVVAAGAGAFALLGGLWAPPPPVPPPAAPSAASKVSMLSSQRRHSVWLSADAGSQTWKSLVSIESAIDSQHAELLNDEQRITAVTNQLGAAAQTPTADPLRPSAPGVLRSELQQLVTDHQAVLGSYNDSLQREYSFYVATAQSSQGTTELTSVAAYAPPEVQQAITTNLSLVQTQLQQEAQIAAASAAEVARMQAAGTEVADLSGPAPSFDAPINGVLTQPFGTTQLPLEPPITYNGVFYPHFHTGLDLAAPMDTPVRAAAAGNVVLAASSVDAQGHLTGYGNFVLIAHADGYNTLYAHLDKILVTVGQAVQQGEQVGLLGTTGWSTGPHVHFEVRKGAVYVDPAPYLGSQIGQS